MSKFWNYTNTIESHLGAQKSCFRRVSKLKMVHGKIAVKFFVRKNKFYSYLTNETLPATEKASRFHYHGKTPCWQSFADASMRKQGCGAFNLEPRVIFAPCQRYSRQIRPVGHVQVIVMSPIPIMSCTLRPCNVLYFNIIAELAERSPIIVQNSSNPSSRKNLDLRLFDRTTDRTRCYF